MSHSPTAAAKDRLAFDKWDRLGLRVTLWFIALATATALVGIPVLRWFQDESLAVPFTSEVQVAQLDAAGIAHGAATYDLLIDHPTPGQRLLDLVPGAVTLAVTGAVIALVLRFLRVIGDGDPFAPGQVRRLRQIAGLLLIGVPVIVLVQLGCTAVLLDGLSIQRPGPEIEFGVPWLPLLVGLCVALIAEAFKTGASLRADVEGLV
ncbi:MAG: DUF2975 domain-containing protein [Tetrasphaera sp.]